MLSSPTWDIFCTVVDNFGDIGVSFTDAPTPHIASVSPAGPAALSGVAAGDLVVAVDGVSTGPLDSSGVEALIANHPPGTRMALTLMRGGHRRVVSLTTRPITP